MPDTLPIRKPEARGILNVLQAQGLPKQNRRRRSRSALRAASLGRDGLVSMESADRPVGRKQFEMLATCLPGIQQWLRPDRAARFSQIQGQTLQLRRSWSLQIAPASAPRYGHSGAGGS